jgi:diguanylate cyclase
MTLVEGLIFPPLTPKVTTLYAANQSIAGYSVAISWLHQSIVRPTWTEIAAMREKPEKPNPQNPAEVAREAFRQLATRRMVPTPNAYRDIYNEIAGTVEPPGPDKVLDGFALFVTELPGEVTYFGQRLQRAVAAKDWEEYGKQLTQLIEKFVANASAAEAPKAITASLPSAPAPATVLVDDQQTQVMREMLSRTLTFAVASLLQGAPELVEETEKLGVSIKDAKTAPLLNDAATRLKQLCFKIELRSGDLAEQQELLLRLFKLLLENVTELLENDSWLSGQIAGVQALLAGPISHVALKDATRSLKEVIYKQGMLKHSLTEAKVTVKNMMITFIDRLSAVATTTGDYHEKIDLYSQKISQAQDIGELNKILDDVMRETKIAQNEALRSRDQMISARQEVQEAEARIHQLETKLEEMSELVREDQLTGSLNRRGLDDVFERELARAERRNSPLCIAMLDLDDFKRLNDTHGHTAGDEALIHLVRVIKDTLRTMDVIARFGGEEFLIVLPDTSMEDAMQTVTRVQRELTKRIFMHNNERLLITFSAGVALRNGTEDQLSMIKRADEALYKAKRAGKNRVVAAT